MCGIVGYTGTRHAVPILIGGLRDLEYRGYDSAGVAVISETRLGPAVSLAKREGRLSNLEAAVAESDDLNGTAGIGHTRWATHGAPTDRNAHPHLSCDGRVVVIHNGIVENYNELRGELRGRGHALGSDTDTEVIVHLMEEHLAAGRDLAEALRLTAQRLEGSQAILAISPSEPGVIVGARIGNAGAIVLGFGSGEMFLASDLAAILPHTRKVAFLADGELVRVTASGVEGRTLSGQPVALTPRESSVDATAAAKGAYATFMLKEIMEQPEAIADTIRSVVTFDPPGLHLSDLGSLTGRLASVRRVVLLGMGTSLHACMIGRRYFEALAHVPAESDNAAEFKYREPVLDGDTLVISVSQSGETVDVLEAMAIARASGAMLATICNTEGAQTTRVADGTVYTRAGLERGVASTKCFLTAVVALYALALEMGRANGTLSDERVARHIGELARIPSAVGDTLRLAPQCEALARRVKDSQDFLFLGRGLAFPVAMEGALKMKEISYIHAEGYSAGEMKHGPIALIDADFPTVAIATKHALRAKMISNIQQVQARSGPVLAIVTEGDEEVGTLAGAALAVPDVSELLEPLVATVPLQLLAYHIATLRGCDVDQPRNLAKTVTVE
ncbi:MAG: glutamine--fructose-6-phosphate transaminase (isomerizing) [Dehalococcoidia bacterium]